jgi:hypothetical protein
MLNYKKQISILLEKAILYYQYKSWVFLFDRL